MSSNDYIPRNDADFNLLQDNIYVTVSINATKWLIPEQSITAFDNERGRWNSAYSKYTDPSKRTPGVTQEKNDARKDYEAVLRPFIQGQLMHNPKVTDADRRNMGLPVHDRTPTPAPPPSSRPELEVAFPQIARHTLQVRDSETKSAGKPAHVIGFEIWRRVGGSNEPTYEEMQLVELATHSPHTLAYPSTERGQMIWYALRWVNSRGEKGPWSEIVSAVIP
jgi:hypothetical protein